MNVGHGSVWLFSQCNQVMLRVTSGVNNREVMCYALLCSAEKILGCVSVPTVLFLSWTVERAECCE
jgi:hypothetical protein